MKHCARSLLAPFLVLSALIVPRCLAQQNPGPSIEPKSSAQASHRSVSSSSAPPKFTDVTKSLGINFEYLASHTSKKYLIETMGSGVALFDYDNDGRLDIFVVNGAPLGDPTAKGTIPQKAEPKYWNRLYHQKA